MKLIIAVLGLMIFSSGVYAADYDYSQQFRLELTSSAESKMYGNSFDVSHEDPLVIYGGTNANQEYASFTIHSDYSKDFGEYANWQFRFGSSGSGNPLTTGFYENTSDTGSWAAFNMYWNGETHFTSMFADFYVHEVGFNGSGGIDRFSVTFKAYQSSTMEPSGIMLDKWIEGSFRYAASGVLPAEAVPAVPEPEAYAMLLAGIGLVGFAVRRKRIQC